MLIVDICFLLIYSNFINEQVWSSGNYLRQYYGGIRDLVNVSGSHEVIKLYAKVPISYILDTTSLSLSIDEDFNRAGNISRIIMTGVMIWGAGKGFINRCNTKDLLLIYYAMTLPLIVYTGFYQSRYFIVYDTYLCVASVGVGVLSGLAQLRKYRKHYQEKGSC